MKKSLTLLALLVSCDSVMDQETCVGIAGSDQYLTFTPEETCFTLDVGRTYYVSGEMEVMNDYNDLAFIRERVQVTYKHPISQDYNVLEILRVEPL